ncbi:unnamed protein product, partial [Staurois parvus]
ADSWRLLCTVRFSICLPHSVIFHVAVVPSCFHFVIIPLTVDCEIFSSKEISRMDLLHGWQPIMLPCLNSLSS